jgi:hypothetical protein
LTVRNLPKPEIVDLVDTLTTRAESTGERRPNEPAHHSAQRS